MDSNTDGEFNDAFGRDALGAGSGFDNCCAFGNSALKMNNADNNTAFGFVALGANTGGVQNCAFGTSALDANTTADNNNAFGHVALGKSTTATKNCAFGKSAGQEVTTGGSNTLIGHDAGGNVTTGDSNVFVGRSSGVAVTTGANNICIGVSAEVDDASATNRIVIGRSISAGANDTFRFGKSGNVVINNFTSNATFTRNSDVSLKKDVLTNEDCGLDFINDLRTVTFKWIDDRSYKEKMYGFIAQEVKAALDKHNITDFNGWTQEKEGGLQGISYEMFVMPLVKAVQELSAKVTALEAA